MMRGQDIYAREYLDYVNLNGIRRKSRREASPMVRLSSTDAIHTITTVLHVSDNHWVALELTKSGEAHVYDSTAPTQHGMKTPNW